MEIPKFLETATKLLDAVENRLSTMDATESDQEWIWLGRALRAILHAEAFINGGVDEVLAEPVGNRLLSLAQLLRKKDVYDGMDLEHYFLNAASEEVADKDISFERCLRRDNVASLQRLATFLCNSCDDFIDWDPDRWESVNGMSEEALCVLLHQNDTIIDTRSMDADEEGGPPRSSEGWHVDRLVPKPALRPLGGATASLDPADPCGDGWLACQAIWYGIGHPWWIEYVRADYGDALARTATDIGQVNTALGMLPELPHEAPKNWTDFAQGILDAAPRSVTAWPRSEVLI